MPSQHLLDRLLCRQRHPSAGGSAAVWSRRSRLACRGSSHASARSGISGSGSCSCSWRGLPCGRHRCLFSSLCARRAGGCSRLSSSRPSCTGRRLPPSWLPAGFLLRSARLAASFRAQACCPRRCLPLSCLADARVGLAGRGIVHVSKKLRPQLFLCSCLLVRHLLLLRSARLPASCLLLLPLRSVRLPARCLLLLPLRSARLPASCLLVRRLLLLPLRSARLPASCLRLAYVLLTPRVKMARRGVIHISKQLRP